MLDKMVGMGYSIPSNVAVSGKEKAIGPICYDGSQSLDFLPYKDKASLSALSLLQVTGWTS